MNLKSGIEVRQATPEDIPELVRFGVRLHAESPRYRDREFNPEKVAALAAALIAIPDTGVHVATLDGQTIGTIVGVLTADWFGDDVYAAELTFFIEPEHRGRRAASILLSALEAWALRQGATEIRSGASTGIEDNGVVHMYTRRGYQPAGYVLRKVL